MTEIEYNQLNNLLNEPHVIPLLLENMKHLIGDIAWVPETKELKDNGYDPKSEGWPILAAGTGDAEQGDAVIARCSLEEDAELIASALNALTTLLLKIEKQNGNQ